MRYEQYRQDFETLYPYYGSAPLMEKFGFTRRHVSKIAYVLGIARLPRKDRKCLTCSAELGQQVPRRSGNLCISCFNKGRRKQNLIPVQHLRSLFHRAKNRAKAKNLIFDLTQEYLWELWEGQNHRCFYSHLEMSTTGRERDPYGVSLDRVLPEKGYVAGNVVLCCWGLNAAKQEFSLTEFLVLCKGVASNPKWSEVRSFDDVDSEKDQVGSRS